MSSTSLALRKGSGVPNTVAQKRDIRAKVAVLEEAMMESGTPVEMPPVHHYAPGLYGRELFMPAGTIITSLIHKVDHFCFVMYGKAKVVDENEGGQIVEGPCMILTKAGTKRALYILEDSLWITVHATDKTDVDEIRKEIISPVHLDKLLAHDEDDDEEQ